MNLYEYIKINHIDFFDKIKFFLDSKDCIVFGGFVKSILINSTWNKELDILCYNYKDTLKEFIEIFTPDSIENIDIHTILVYGEYRIDVCDMFITNDFSFNSLGLIGENLVIVPNIFIYNIEFILNQLDKKEGFESKICPNYKKRKEKYKDWKILKRW